MQIYGAKTDALIKQAEIEGMDKDAIQERRKELETRANSRSHSIEIGSWCAVAFAIGCVLYGFFGHGDDRVKRALLAVWIVIVPLWFALETFYLYDPKRDADLDAFKQGQDVASKAWLAVAVVLAALYFGKDCFHL